MSDCWQQPPSRSGSCSWFIFPWTSIATHLQGSLMGLPLALMQRKHSASAGATWDGNTKITALAAICHRLRARLGRDTLREPGRAAARGNAARWEGTRGGAAGAALLPLPRLQEAWGSSGASATGSRCGSDRALPLVGEGRQKEV